MSQHNTIAIDVRDLVKVYEKRGRPPLRAVDGISFSVRKGEIFGLLGPNGAGKTTTFKILTTLLPPTSGSVSVFGHNVVAEPLEVRKNICVVLQENAVELYLSVRNNFLTFGRFHGLSRRDIEERTARIVRLFGLEEYLDFKAIDLSGGLKRRLQVAKTFLVDKPVVFLDEATTGMDTFNKRTTMAAIKKEAERGRTIVLTTHVLEEAEELCDTVAIINHGRIEAFGSVEKVKSLGLRLLYVWLAFEKLSQRTLQQLRRLKPLKLEVRDSTVEATVRDEHDAMRFLAVGRRSRYLRSFEVNTASLEDVFVELIDKRREA